MNFKKFVEDIFKIKRIVTILRKINGEKRK